MNGIPYMWDPKRNDTNELTYETERDSENELMVAGGWGEGGEWIVRKLGINMYTLLYLKWITNKDAL